MLQLSQIKISYKDFEKKDKAQKLEILKARVFSILGIKNEEFLFFQIAKKSIDARKKPDIFFSYTVIFSLENEGRILKKKNRIKNLSVYKKGFSLEDRINNVKNYQLTEQKNKFGKIVVVGCGPAGLFFSYFLACCGLKPVIVERGKKIEDRVKDVNEFWENNKLAYESNVSFGEGGAGTFSDGKLNTSVKDKTGKKAFVLQTFVKFGAKEDILYDAKPHIGTDVLRTVIVNMRKEMERLGCEFKFETKLCDLKFDVTDGEKKIKNIVTNKGEIECDNLVIAIGHSARDTFSMLYEKQIKMSQKPFAIGVRLMHDQKKIDMIQYGLISDALPSADYKLTAKTDDDRGVYSFCMCPGGYVVNASSEKNRLVVNGMSDEKRDSGCANAAIVVSVGPEDFKDEHPLSGMEFQREWEEKMYRLCDGAIPVESFGHFAGKYTKEKEPCFSPKIKGNWKYAPVEKALPVFVKNGIIKGMMCFGEKMKGFDSDDSLILGIETRTSSPVRIERDNAFQCINFKGIYPCGEGAGYAGGIMSAAMDGLRLALSFTSEG